MSASCTPVSIYTAMDEGEIYLKLSCELLVDFFWLQELAHPFAWCVDLPLMYNKCLALQLWGYWIISLSVLSED